jgi:hypothetical protein
MRRETYADECSRPLCVSYSRCDIEDQDDFPDGNYELTFDRRRILLSKTAGRYLLAPANSLEVEDQAA